MAFRIKPENQAKFLRTFHLCARKWVNDDDAAAASLAGFLVRIENLASAIEQSDVGCSFFGCHLDSLKQDINQWYIKFSEYCSRQSSSCSQPDLSIDEIVELIDSLLDTLDFLFHDYHFYRDEDLGYLLDSLIEKITFLKNFIRFTTFQVGKVISIADDDSRQHFPNLLTHIRAVAITAAHYSYMMMDYINLLSEPWPLLRSKSLELLRGIKPIDPQVYDTCIQTLNASKLSRQPHTTTTLEEDVNVLKDFITSLLSHLLEILKAGTISVFSSKDQLQILHDELRSLRYILENQPKNFDENMWDLTGVVVCDAGIVIFSLFHDSIEYGLAKDMNHILFDLLERIKLITAKLARKSPQGSIFNFDELRFVDFLLQNLAELTNPEAGSAAIPNLQIQTIYEGLVFLRPFLGKIFELHDQEEEKEELQALWSNVVELANKVEFLVDSLATRDIVDSAVMSFDSFDSIVEEIKTTKLDALKIFDKKGFDVEETKVAEKCDHFSLERSMPRIEDEIVGFAEEATSIMNRLKRGKQLQIVAIVGMPGSGKTTLAKMVYNHASIYSHFRVLAWCCISQVYNKQNSLLEILSCIIHELPKEYFEKSEEDLALEVYQKLKKKKYLIVLDDVWDISAWNELKASFPDDANGSKIVLTSRGVDSDPKDKLYWETHDIRQLTNDESLKLLKTKLFPKAGWPPSSCELSQQIFNICKGLPLTIVILAGMLATLDQDGWKEIDEHLNSGMVSVVDKCKNVLELSYQYLPNNLKQCFLYFGVFPEDQELTTKKLTRLWIAEGFVSKTQSKSLEHEAMDYLRYLIRRSLVMIGKRSSNGGIKTCHIHDLLHEFCVKKAREERFFQFLQGYNELSGFNEAHKVHRLVIRSNKDHFKKSRIFCPRLRCLFFSISESWAQGSNPLSYIGTSKAVRVLNWSQFGGVRKYPAEVELLVQLRYLSLGSCSFNSIPSSIANLVNLETLIVSSFSIMCLPNSIWNLKKLRHIEVEGSYFYVDDEHIDNVAQSCNLDTISISFHLEYAEKTLKRFPNIRKLRAYGNVQVDAGGSDEENDNVLVLDCLRQLESLNLSSNSALKVEFSCLLNLKKLTLSNICLPWCKMSSIGNLPNLEVLKLHHSAFVGKIWKMEEARQFPRLKFLELSRLYNVKWTATGAMQDHFPCLVKLVLDRCHELKELPSCLADINLEMIEIYHCYENLRTSLQQILEVQESMGNENLSVVIHYWNPDCTPAKFMLHSGSRFTNH